MPPNEPMNVPSSLLELDLQATVQTPICSTSTHPEIDPYQDQTFGRIDRTSESQDLQHSQQASEIGHLERSQGFVIDPFSALPLELIPIIFSYLTLQERLRCLGVSRRWLDELVRCPGVWPQASPVRIYTSKIIPLNRGMRYALEGFWSNGGDTKSADLVQEDLTLDMALVDLLVFAHRGNGTLDSLFLQIGSSEIQMYDDSCQRFFSLASQACLHLTNLELSLWGVSDADLLSILRDLKFLETLSFCGHIVFHDCPFDSHQFVLRTLSLGTITPSCPQLDLFIGKILSCSPDITSLSMNLGTLPLDGPTLTKIQSMDKLEQLNFDECRGIIVLRSPHLTRLGLIMADTFPVVEQRNPIPLSELRHLKLESLPDSSYSCYLAFSYYDIGANLECLVLYNCDNQRQLLEMCNKAPKLWSLELPSMKIKYLQLTQVVRTVSCQLKEVGFFKPIQSDQEVFSTNVRGFNADITKSEITAWFEKQGIHVKYC
jgi:hypothetical protein